MASMRSPEEIETVFRDFRTCEFSTLARDGTPIIWPVQPFYPAKQGQFPVTASPGLAEMAFNIPSNLRVSLLFSDSAAKGMASPPAVLVQGDAETSDEVLTSITDLEDILLEVYEGEPGSGLYGSNPVTRFLLDCYYTHLLLYVRPCRFLS